MAAYRAFVTSVGSEGASRPCQFLKASFYNEESEGGFTLKAMCGSPSLTLSLQNPFF